MDEMTAAVLPFQGVALALALGLLIGIERGWSRRRLARAMPCARRNRASRR